MRFDLAGCWLVVALVFFVIVHLAACVVLSFWGQTTAAILFGCVSFGCMMLIAHFTVQARRDATNVFDLRASPYIDNDDCISSGGNLHGSLPRDTCAYGNEFEDQPWFTWLVTLNIVSTDVVWALCGIRSFWFLLVLSKVPKRVRGPIALVAVALVLCSVLLGIGRGLKMGLLGVSIARIFGRNCVEMVVIDVVNTLLPSLLFLAQLVAVEAQRRSKNIRQNPMNLSSNSLASRLSSLDRPSKSLFNDSFRVCKTLSYSVSTMIASGGFSEVFLGLSHDTGELICVKQLAAGFDSTDIATMEAEVAVLRSLSHPNIVKYLGTDQRDQFTILLEYVPGGSIDLLLSQFGALDEEVVKLYVRQALWGLQYLHHECIIHHDIKGANILVSDRGEVKLTDFGCSYSTLMTKDACLAMGTVLWMAPEVCRQDTSSFACDIWSLGCTILQMATNRVPWHERQFEHTIPAFFHIATCTEPPQVASHLSQPMREVVLECLQLEASCRPSCSQLLQMPWFCCPRLSSDQSLTSETDGEEGHAPVWSRRHKEKQATESSEASPSMAHLSVGLLEVPEPGFREVSEIIGLTPRSQGSPHPLCSPRSQGTPRRQKPEKPRVAFDRRASCMSEAQKQRRMTQVDLGGRQQTLSLLPPDAPDEVLNAISFLSGDEIIDLSQQLEYLHCQAENLVDVARKNSICPRSNSIWGRKTSVWGRRHSVHPRNNQGWSRAPSAKVDTSEWPLPLPGAISQSTSWPLQQIVVESAD